MNIVFSNLNLSILLKISESDNLELSIDLSVYSNTLKDRRFNVSKSRNENEEEDIRLLNDFINRLFD